MSAETARLKVTGMTCGHCQGKVTQALLALPGVVKAEVSLAGGTANVTYDPSKVGETDLVKAVEKAGYKAGKGSPARTAAAAVGMAASAALIYLMLTRFGAAALSQALPLAQAGMGYGMLFVIGLITSVHCVVMCGGINLSQCMGGGRTLRPSLMYNLGRVIAYTAVGGLVGALGSVFSLSSTLKGAIQIVAGVFMVVMGLNMTGLFPWLSRLVPRMPSGIARGITKKKGSAGPLYVGLLNGLMPCGPLQAMQLYALSTGSALHGALSMLVFSLGTVPLMFLLGSLGSLMSRKFTRRAMAAGAVLVVALGLSMFTGGLNLSGATALPSGTQAAAQTPKAGASDKAGASQEVQKVRTSLAGGRYQPITVTAGVPVEWTIDAPKGSINGCNGRMVIPAYGIEYAFKQGENVISFTPDKPGTYRYTCWMGMIASTITVTEPGGK